jgi:KUP system potassium uptake protein
MHAAHDATGSAMSVGAARRRFALLALGSMGVVFGDIGTSPLYAFQGAVTAAAHGAVGESEIFGITSLIIWALLIVVTAKYVFFIMRADNHGEGGILSLMALAQNALGRRTAIVLGLGVIGAAMFYGDAIITPAISVLSAVEGLETVPSLAHAITPAVEISSSLFLLIVLFMVQSRGTAKVAAWFGPICVVWFVSIAALGVMQIPREPRILLAFLPTYGVGFLVHHGFVGMLVLGAVSLTITGAEALYADMGHFGAAPIRGAWLAIVFPALLINYLGQGAFALRFLADAANHGADLTAQNWFFLMVPEALRIPMVVLATAATIIASQAVISGAYSMTNSAMQMGLLPRLHVRRTSETEAGQIYMPTVNMMLMVGVIFLVAIFKNEAALQDAYGLAVTGTMSVTTALTAVVVRRQWKWSRLHTAVIVAPLLAVDLTFYSANMLKLLTGGWVPLAIAGGVIIVIATWIRGSDIVVQKASKDRIPLDDFLASIARRPRQMVSGVAVYLTPNADLTPSALLHNLKHNGVLHEKNALVTVHTTGAPRVPAAERASFRVINDHFAAVTLNFGFMETPRVPDALRGLKIEGVNFDSIGTSYFLGRRSIVAGHDHGLRRVRDRLFIALTRNSADPSEVFGIPAGQVIEMGVQVSV